jgi:hypothetical protein
MPLIDKNIRITPNVGQVANPEIVFSGASDVLGPQNITLTVLPTENGTLTFQGSNGNILSITNSTTNSVFSVNSSSTNTSISVLPTGIVNFAPVNGRILIGPATDNTLDRLQVSGNTRLDGDLVVTGSFQTSSINNTPIGNITRSSGAFTTLTSNGATTFTSTTASTSSSTGALVVSGGVGIGGSLFVGGSFTTSSINNTPIGNTTPSTGAFTTLAANNVVSFTLNQASTSTTTGTLRVTGGVGISGNIYTGGTVALTANSTRIQQTSTSTWSGDAGAGLGKLEYHSNRWYVNAGTDSTEVVRFRRGATDVAWLTNAGALSISSTLTVSGNNITMAATDTRDKYRVWNDSNYTIGMQNSYTFGSLNNNYAMTFQMNNDDNRGFWWGDAAHTNAQGAMALSTHGRLTVAHSIRAGYGETDTTVPGATYRLDVSGDGFVSGKMRIGTPFWENIPTISANSTLATGVNTMSIGPVTINDGVSVTVPDGGSWTVV